MDIAIGTMLIVGTGSLTYPDVLVTKNAKTSEGHCFYPSGPGNIVSQFLLFLQSCL